MFFPESEAIAREHPNLLRLIEQIDQQLSSVISVAVLRPTDFSCAFGADENQVRSVFDLLAQQGVLQGEKMIECDQCQNLMSTDAVTRAVENEDKLECSVCGRTISRKARPLKVYRVSASAMSRSKSQSRPQKAKTAKRCWPDPERHTTAKVWTVKQGALRISTKTNGNDDGAVEFALTDAGKPTAQMRFMQLLCFKHPTPVTLAEVIQEIYPADLASIGQSGALMKTLRKLRTLVSDVRTKKLAKANLNPDILPSLNIDATKDTSIVLKLAQLHRMDDKQLDGSDKPALRTYLRSSVTP